MPTKEQAFLTSLAKGEFDSKLAELGEAIHARHKEVRNRQATKNKNRLTVGSRAKVKASSDWKHNGTIVTITRINQSTATTVIEKSNTLNAGQAVRFHMSVLAPLTTLDKATPVASPNGKRRIKRGSR